MWPSAVRSQHQDDLYVSKSASGAFEQGLRHLQSLSGENQSRMLLVKAERKLQVEVDLHDMYVEERTLLNEIDTPVHVIFREQALVSLVPKRCARVCAPKPRAWEGVALAAEDQWRMEAPSSVSAKW